MIQSSVFNQIKKQKLGIPAIPTTIQHSRNLSDQRSIGNKLQSQQLMNTQNYLRNIQDQENIQLNVNRIQQGPNCQIQYFFPNSAKRMDRNQTPVIEQKKVLVINNVSQPSQNNLTQVRNPINDYNTTQEKYCEEVELNVIEKKDNSITLNSNKVQSNAAKNIKDLLQYQRRSSSQKSIINNNNQSFPHITNDKSTDQLNKQLQSAQKSYTRTQKIDIEQNYSQQTPQLERKKNSNSMILNQRAISNNKQSTYIQTEESQKKVQQYNYKFYQQLKSISKKQEDKYPINISKNQQNESRLPSKSSQQNRNQQFTRHRIKTLGNEGNDNDDLKIFQKKNNDSPFINYNDTMLSNKKQDIKISQIKNPSKLKMSRDLDRIQGNIQENSNLKRFLSKESQKQSSQTQLNVINNENDDKKLFKISNSLGRSQHLKDDQNQNKCDYSNQLKNRENKNQMISTQNNTITNLENNYCQFKENINNLQLENDNLNKINTFQEVSSNMLKNRNCRASSLYGMRKRILTKSSEKIKQNLQLSVDHCSDKYQTSRNIQTFEITTTIDSNGSTKNSNTIKFTNRTDLQNSQKSLKIVQPNNINQNNISISTQNFNSLQTREDGLNLEKENEININYSPYNPKIQNNQFLIQSKIDEETYCSQDISSVFNNSQKIIKKVNSNTSLHSPILKYPENLNDNKYYDLYNLNNISSEINEKNTINVDSIERLTSPQFLKLRFKKTSSITKEKNFSTKDNAQINTWALDTNNNFKQQKKKLMIKTINPYKSEEKRDCFSYIETPNISQSGVCNIGNTFGLLRQSQYTFPKSPTKINSEQNNNNVLQSKQEQFDYTTNERECASNDQQVINNFQNTNQNHNEYSTYKKQVSQAEIVSPDHNIFVSQSNFNSSTDKINYKKKLIHIRPTRVPSNERKNNKSYGGLQVLQNSNKTCQTTQQLNNSESQNCIQNNKVTYNQEKNYFSVNQQQQNKELNADADFFKQQNYQSTQFKVQEFKLSQDNFQQTQPKDKLSNFASLEPSTISTTNLISFGSTSLNPSTKTNIISKNQTTSTLTEQVISVFINQDQGNNQDVQFVNHQKNNKSQFKINNQEIQKDCDQINQHKVIESKKLDDAKDYLKQLVDDNKEKLCESQNNHIDSIQELQNDLQELKLNVQIENMNQNFAILNKNLNLLNNNFNHEYSEIDNLIPQDSQNNILDQIDSYRFDNNLIQEDTTKYLQLNYHMSILDSNQNWIKINQNQNQVKQSIFQSQGELISQNILQHSKINNDNIEISIINNMNDDQNIFSQLEKEKTEFEQKLFQEKVKFEQRQQQLQKEFMNQKYKLLQSQQLRQLAIHNSSQKQIFNQQQPQILQQTNSCPSINYQLQCIKDLNQQNQIFIPNGLNNNQQNVWQQNNQCVNQSMDISFFQNPNLESDVSKLFKQEQISQILPASQCSFLSDNENVLETNNNSQILSSNSKKQYIEQQLNQDTNNIEINIPQQRDKKSTQNNFNQNYFPPINSHTIEQAELFIKSQNNIQSFPNIYKNQIQVNSNKLNLKPNPQINSCQQQDIVIEELDCEQSTESPFKGYNQLNKNIQNSQQNSNRMPPLPLNTGYLIKMKKNSSFHQNQQQLQNQIRDSSQNTQKENQFNSLNVSNQQTLAKINNNTIKDVNQIQGVKSEQFINSDKHEDEQLNTNNSSKLFFNGNNLNRGRKQRNSLNQYQGEMYKQQLRMNSESQDKQDKYLFGDDFNLIQNNKIKNRDKNKRFSLQRNNTDLNNLKYDIIAEITDHQIQVNQHNQNNASYDKFNQISESIKKQKMLKVERNSNFPSDFFPNTQNCLKKIMSSKVSSNLQYQNFTNNSSNSSHRFEQIHEEMKAQI